METVILVIHMLAALSIVGLILLQQGKGAEMGASFGAGASQTLFGSQGGGNFFSRATAAIAVIFFATSFGLAIVAKNKAGVEDDFQLSVPVEEVPQEEAPAAASEVPVDNAAEQAVPSDVPVDEGEPQAGAAEPASEVPADDVPAGEVPEAQSGSQ